MERERWERVRDVFEEVRRMPASEQEARVRRSCADDPAVEAEVLSLLRAQARPGLLDRPPWGTNPPAGSADVPVPDRVGPYVVIDEIGRGGMAVVVRAIDPRLEREVALKIVRPRPGPGTDARSFLMEARAVASLDHPGICTVYEADLLDDGRVYIAMPYYRSGTLADRLGRGPLGIDEATRVAIAVARALGAAHDAGVVHRDVKPANIAFDERGDVRLLDFGVALLGGQDPSAVLRAGTPAYMAPEQADGRPTDPRADLWALGVVLYEALAGRRPDASGRVEEGEAGMAADLSSTRPEVPRALGRVVERALRRRPEERFQSAAEMEAALLECQAWPGSGRSRRRRLLATVAAAIVAGAALFTVRAWKDAGVPALDPELVLVLPFRVSSDSSLIWLREGMVDLLAAKLTGGGGLRAADPRTVEVLRRALGVADSADPTEAALAELGRRLGATRAVLGEVVGTDRHLVVNASLVDTQGVVEGRASARGGLDSLPEIVDRLVAELLSAAAGEHPQRLAELTSTSLPALRAFLEGQAAYRGGEYERALLRYGHALEYDTSFALAGLGMGMASGWVSGATQSRQRGLDVAWAFRDRLGTRDRQLLVAVAGPNYPGLSAASEIVEAVGTALTGSPDRAELWYEQGDLQLHVGRVLGHGDWRSRAESAFRRTLELDPSFAAAGHHLVVLHAEAGDLDALRSTVSVYLADEPTGPTADWVRWRAFVAGLDDVRTVPLEAMSAEALGWIAILHQDEGIASADGALAARLLAERQGTRGESFERRLGLFAHELNAGRSGAAGGVLARVADVQPDPGFVHRLALLTVLWADGDAAAAEAAADALARAPEGPRSPLDRCVLAQWRALHDGDRAPPAWARDEPASAVAAGDPRLAVCTAVVSALLEPSVAGAPRGALDTLTDLVRSGVAHDPLIDGHTDYAALALARLLEARGDPTGALDALRRRSFFHGYQPYLSRSLLDEVRLAAEVGDTLGTLRAGRHFLALRPDPEPHLEPQSREVRRILEELGQERR